MHELDTMASQAYQRLAGSLSHLGKRASGDDSYPWNYTSVNGHVCDMPRPMLNTETATLAGGHDFFTINQIITGACACFTLLSLSVLMFRHATHLSRPNEQLTIMRICCYLPIFCIGCLVEVSFPNAYVYLNAWLDVAQALALCNFFLMMCQFVSPSDSRRETFFAALHVPQKKSRRRGTSEPVNGLLWYRRMWLSIFQYPVVSTLVAVFTAITESQGVYCLVSSGTYFAHLWLGIIHNVSLAMAVMACLRLLSGLRGRLPHHRPWLKLIAFKLLIGITGLIQVSLPSMLLGYVPRPKAESLADHILDSPLCQSQPPQAHELSVVVGRLHRNSRHGHGIIDRAFLYHVPLRLRREDILSRKRRSECAACPRRCRSRCGPGHSLHRRPGTKWFVQQQ